MTNEKLFVLYNVLILDGLQFNANYVQTKYYTYNVNNIKYYNHIAH